MTLMSRVMVLFFAGLQMKENEDGLKRIWLYTDGTKAWHVHSADAPCHVSE